ncbi:hypothetical protein SAMD00019534_098510 [Acytostelium subglobosum LB1]|uniref:hypothetical protein n=1 Tax=Acytostelium subglobosum LB1 TaxID=1410327 RepID=UPI0006451DFD|nr:hypothetical protein SAMD00019534_098510 [Acytostelium subglobosum LB1]GAM26676.1 hypothetical protein SAMD00019534_098510 [Acytostelium subglobosum LB1]|eukprot:XP_012750337.1 hypothetical protein SAMD00019534_098510 [Acytostelium subglobosum LB1]
MSTTMVYLMLMLLLSTIVLVQAGPHNAPVLRFSKNLLTLPDGGHSQLSCRGGTAKGSNEEPPYIFCLSSLDDIFDPNAQFRCQSPNPSSYSTISKYTVVCKRGENDHNEYTFGDDHPCHAQYSLDWIEVNQIRVIGWGILGCVFFYLFLTRTNNSFYQQINNPMSFPREPTNPKIFMFCGIFISLTIVVSMVVFVLLCLYMFSAPV